MSLLLHIDSHNGVPVYRQIMDQIKLQVAAGVLKDGEELPSTRALSVELSLNPMTISKAYGFLEREGVLERRRGQTLTVKAAAVNPEAKLAPLKEALAQAATLAKQLEISKEQAVRLFRQSLEDENS